MTNIVLLSTALVTNKVPVYMSGTNPFTLEMPRHVGYQTQVVQEFRMGYVYEKVTITDYPHDFVRIYRTIETVHVFTATKVVTNL